MTALRALWQLARLGLLAVLGAYLYIQPSLPSVQELRDVRLQTPLRVLAADGALLAVYGTKHRIPVTLEQTPLHLRQAFIAAEDARFYAHPGVDVHALLRAAIDFAASGVVRQGGSTITMQLARNFYLTPQRQLVRKLREIFLALRLEREFSKDEILELYMNKIFLGHRAYGVAAAAETYFGVPPAQLSLAQIATIAGLPKAPSSLNPVSNPEAARARRRYVLTRMLDEGYIDRRQHDAAAAVALGVDRPLRAASPAPHFTEMIRADLVARYGADAYTSGYTVRTTLRPDLQAAAVRAVRRGLASHDRRHGWRGPVRRGALPEDRAGLEALLAATPALGGYANAVVTQAGAQAAYLYLGGERWAELRLAELAWARPVHGVDHYGPPPLAVTDVLAEGDVVRLEREDGVWRLRQAPQAEGALVALDPDSGAVLALVGGFDFAASKFNRASQARRQPGSGFKPFLYSAALEYGYTPSTIVNDAPIVYRDDSLEGAWRPKNYSGDFHGPTRVRTALVRSLNVVSVRILKHIGIPYARDYVERFGFAPERLPGNLTLALGTGEATPLEMAASFAIFANGGYRVAPYWIARIEDRDGAALYAAQPRRACPPPCAQEAALGDVGWMFAEDQAPRVLDRRVRYQIASMLHDAVRTGTARRARELGRDDLAGKTGTTNSLRDAWFNGFHPDLVATAWVGRDDNESLGRRETGSRAALPIWMDFMRTALAGAPPRPLEPPPGIVQARIDARTGLLADADDADSIVETYRQELVPTRLADSVLQLPHDAQAHTPEQGVF